MQRDIPEYKTSEFFGKGQRTVRFNHEIHTLDLFCSGCHPRLFSIKKGSNKITMADHGKGGKCFFCHDGNKVFSVNSCNRCHAKVEMPREVIAYGKGEKEILFRHQTHSGKLKCGTCHTKLFPFQKGVTKIAFAEHNSGKACFNCHTGKNGAAFYDCSRCHKDRGAAAPQAALTYTIKDTGPVNFSHKNHASFACGQCHPDLFAMKKGGTKMAMAEMYQGKSCGTCHDGKKAFRAMECAKCHKMN